MRKFLDDMQATVAQAPRLQLFNGNAGVKRLESRIDIGLLGDDWRFLVSPRINGGMLASD